MSDKSVSLVKFRNSFLSWFGWLHDNPVSAWLLTADCMTGNSSLTCQTGPGCQVQVLLACPVLWSCAFKQTNIYGHKRSLITNYRWCFWCLPSGGEWPLSLLLASSPKKNVQKMTPVSLLLRCRPTDHQKMFKIQDDLSIIKILQLIVKYL